MSTEEWQILYEEHANDVYKFLVCFFRSVPEAEDVLQETFIKAHLNRHQLPQVTNVRAWLLTIARHLAVDRVRKKERTVKLLGWLVRERQPEPQRTEEHLLAKELGYEVLRVLQTLPPAYRTVVILRGLQDHSPKETAEILGWTVNKVNVTYHRALQKARGLFPEKEGER